MRALTAEQNSAQSEWGTQQDANAPLGPQDGTAARLPAGAAPRFVGGGRQAFPGTSERVSDGEFDEQQLRFARCRAAEFFRAVGLEDPDVLAAASHHAVRVALRSLRGGAASSAIARLPQATIATADAMRRRTIRRLDDALPGEGGASRRGELSMRLATVLAERPECLLESRIAEEVIRLARGDKVQGLEMPTEEPVPFPPQSLVDTRPHRLWAVCRGSLRWCRRWVFPH